MVGLRDRAEAEAFENEQNKIKIEEVKEEWSILKECKN